MNYQTDKKTSTELTTFIGVFVDSLLKEGYSASEAKRMISQDLINESLVLCDDGKGSYDYYALQSLFLSVSYVLSKEVNMLESETEKVPQIKNVIDKEKEIIAYLENRVKAVNKK